MGLAGLWCSSSFPYEAKARGWWCGVEWQVVGSQSYTSYPQALPYTNQISKKEAKPSISRRQVTGGLMERKLFSSKKEMTFRSGWTHGVKEFIKGWLASEHARSQSSWEHLVYNWRKNIQRSSIQNDKRVLKKWQHFAWKYVTLDTLMKFENSSPTGLEKGLMNKGGHCGY